jgi:hypothetical protein
MRVEPRVGRNKQCIQRFTQETCKEESLCDKNRWKVNIKTNLKGIGCMGIGRSMGLQIGFSVEIF